METRSNYLVVVAVDSYQSEHWKSLNNAVKDANEVVDILTERYGFDLLSPPLFNEKVTRKSIGELFASTIPLIGPDDNLIVYYAGHGYMNPLTSKGYWVPHEAGLHPSDMISNSEIKDFIEALEAKHVLLIADSCFSGTFITRNRGAIGQTTYHDLDRKKSRWVMTSGQEQTVSDGIVGKNSPFVMNLKRFLLENTNAFASVQEMITYVSATTAATNDQKPQGAPITNVGHEDGQLILQLGELYVKMSVESTNGRPASHVLRKELRLLFDINNKFMAGKEVILFDMHDDKKTLIMAENFRFDGEGKRKLSFTDSQVLMGKDAKYPMYARASTWVGMERYLEENQNLYRNFEIFMMPADKSIDQVEETEQAIYQQEIIQDLINQNAEIMKCLHCGAMISTNDSFTVEIDELDLRAAAGNVHKECLRPVDRMIGRSIFPDATETLLTNFDYQKWADLIAKGQYFINSVVQMAKGNPLAMISWNKEHLRNTGNYCVRIALSDGTTDYLRSGRSIERFSEEEIDQHLEMIVQNEIKMGKLSIKKIFGSLDYLSSIKSEDEDLFSVTQYTKVRYSNQLDGSNLQDYNDYAPLGLLKSLEGKTILLGDIVPLVSSPILFDELYQNWTNASFVSGPATLHILADDKEVDFNFMGFLDDGLLLVIDPKFDKSQNLISGIRISDFRKITKAVPSRQRT